MPLSPTEILLGFALPTVVCLGMLIAAWQPWRGERDGRWVGGLAVATGFAIAYGRLVGGMRFPRGWGDNGFVYIAGGGAVVGVAFCMRAVPPWGRVALVAALSASVCFLLLKPLIGEVVSPLAAAG